MIAKSSKRTFWLVVSLCTNFGILFYYKYSDFFLDILNHSSINTNYANNSYINTLVPVGLSFYTFQTVSYTIDVYRRKIKPETNFISFAAYVSYFPQLVAGPIERASTLLPQIKRKKHFNSTYALDGLQQALWGFFKKLVIADNCGRFVDEVFSHYDTGSTLSLVLGLYFFIIQVYCDFSGYVDIAIGISKCFSIKLSKNFSTPLLLSENIIQLWRRWHITLGSWMKDYVLTPLISLTNGKYIFISIIFTFILVGLWHGANWTFFVFGAIHGIAHVFNYSMGRLYKKPRPQWMRPINVFITFSFFAFSTVFFRAPSLNISFKYLENLFFKPLTVNLHTNISAIVLGIVFMFLIEWINRKESYGFSFRSMKLNKYLIFSLNLILSFMILKCHGSPTTFIYFRF